MAPTNGEKSDEELEMTEGEDNAELSGNSGLYCAVTGDVAPLNVFERIMGSAKQPTAWFRERTEHLRYV